MIRITAILAAILAMLVVLSAPVRAGIASEPCENAEQRQRARELALVGGETERPREHSCIVDMAQRVASNRLEAIFGQDGERFYLRFNQHRFYGSGIPEGNMAAYWDGDTGQLLAVTFYGTIDEPAP